MDNVKLKPIFINEDNEDTTILCPVCSDLLTKEANVCPNCGTPIDWDDII